jgi:hypothetical protein
MQATKSPGRFKVTCDGDGVNGHAGSARWWSWPSGSG